MKAQPLRLLLVNRQWKVRDLAAKTGINLRYLENQFACDFTSEPARIRIENALEITIWSTIEDFNRAAAQTKLFGFDPRLAKLRELQQLAKKHGITAPTNLRKPRLIEKITAELLAEKTKTKLKRKNYAAKN